MAAISLAEQIPQFVEGEPNFKMIERLAALPAGKGVIEGVFGGLDGLIVGSIFGGILGLIYAVVVDRDTNKAWSDGLMGAGYGALALGLIGAIGGAALSGPMNLPANLPFAGNDWLNTPQFREGYVPPGGQLPHGFY